VTPLLVRLKNGPHAGPGISQICLLGNFGGSIHTPEVGWLQAVAFHDRLVIVLDVSALVRTMVYGGRVAVRSKTRARYSPIIPNAKSCAPLKIMIAEARNGKPGADPITK
jgi:hypothetical protein